MRAHIDRRDPQPHRRTDSARVDAGAAEMMREQGQRDIRSRCGTHRPHGALSRRPAARHRAARGMQFPRKNSCGVR
ncbi:MAG: hypothetical protein MZV63_06225 [Marinilabiliales bacterium]|nr:hypothetical protein [Marinilabiliales bacterium]